MEAGRTAGTLTRSRQRHLPSKTVRQIRLRRICKAVVTGTIEAEAERVRMQPEKRSPHRHGAHRGVRARRAFEMLEMRRLLANSIYAEGESRREGDSHPLCKV